MSYDPKLLFGKISTYLHECPRKTLRDLAQNLRVSPQTIKKAIRLSRDQSFSRFRQEILLKQARRCLLSRPTVSIKELSFCLGFKSASSFARSIRRLSGASPEELRSHLACHLPVVDKPGIAIDSDTPVSES